MTAPCITIFFPQEIEHESAISRIVDKLSLSVDELPEGDLCDFSAQRRERDSYFLIEGNSNCSEIIQELCEWERPSDTYKQVLAKCMTKAYIHYRGIHLAKRCLAIISEVAGEASLKCVVENDHGCLLLLSDIMTCLEKDSEWTWERERFPDLPGVADSEWLE